MYKFKDTWFLVCKDAYTSKEREQIHSSGFLRGDGATGLVIGNEEK